MSYSRDQSFTGDEERNDWSRLSQSVATNVQKISQNVNSMQRMVNRLGTSEDSETLRHEIQHYTNQLARDTNNSLKELAQLPQSNSASEQKQRQTHSERLTNDFSEAIKSFQLHEFSTGTSSEAKARDYQSNFYRGKTVFGGANVTRAARLAGTTPYNLSQRHHLAPVLKVNVKPSKVIDSSDRLSTSSKRIFEKLEKASTPLQDARRTPYYTSAQLKDYFKSANTLYQSPKRPKLGPPTSAAPVPSRATIDQRFKPMRWQLVETKDDNKVSSSETSDQFINTCDNYSSIDSDINASKGMKSNETFGGKIMRRDLKRDEKRPKTQIFVEPNDTFDLSYIQPLSMSSLPTISFGKQSSTPLMTTTNETTITTNRDQVFKFSAPVLKTRDKNSELICNKSVTDSSKQPIVVDSPLSAITTKPSISLKTFEKESNALKDAIKRSVDTSSDVKKDKVFSNINLVKDKESAKKSEHMNEKWICVCLYNNSSQTSCKACGKDRNSQIKQSVPISKTETIVKPIEKTTTPTVQTFAGWGDKFKAPSDSWTCSVCMVTNGSNDTKCQACEEPKPSAKPKTIANESPKPTSDLWKCFYCNENNNSSKNACNSCAKVKTPIATKADLDKLYGGQTFKFGINEDKTSKKDNLIQTLTPIDDKIDSSVKSSEKPLILKSTETSSKISTSTPNSNQFTFGLITTTEAPKQSFELKSIDTTNAGTVEGFKFIAPEDTKLTSDDKPSEKSNTGIVDVFGPSNTNTSSLFQFGTQSATTSAASLATTTTTTAAQPNQPFVFGSQNSGQDLFKNNKKVSFDFINKTEDKAAETTTNKLNPDLTATGFQFDKPSAEDKPQSVKAFNPLSNNSLFGLVTTAATPVGTTTTSNSTTNTSFGENKLNSSLNESQSKSIGSLFGGQTATTSASFSSLFSATNNFNSILTTPTTSAQTSGGETATKSLFSKANPFDAKNSSNLSQNSINTSATTSAKTSLLGSTAPSAQNAFVFGSPNTTSPSFSLQTTTVTTKPNFSFNITTNASPSTTSAAPDKKFGSNTNLFGSNANKGFTFGNTSLNSTQTPAFSFSNPSTHNISNTFSGIEFGLSANNDKNSKPATNQLFSFGSSGQTSGQTNGQISNSFLPQKPLNSNTSITNSTQFTFGNPNPSTGQTKSANMFGNATNSAPNNISFNQLSTPTAPANPYTFGGFGSTQSTPSVPQIQSQPQSQPLPSNQFNFSTQPSFDFGSIGSVPNAGAAPGAPVFQFSAEQPVQSQPISRITKKAKRRLNPP